MLKKSILFFFLCIQVCAWSQTCILATDTVPMSQDALLLQRKMEYYRLNNNISDRSTILIPVVIHVVWNENDENISEKQIKSQLEILNACFSDARDANLVPAAFKDNIGKPNIQFCLAQKDPKGKPTTGITRTETNISGIASSVAVYYGAKGGANAWDTKQYLNIWVAAFTDNSIGKSAYPGTVPLERDGIVVSPRHFGNIGTAADTDGHDLGLTAVHELGHYFNLIHIWGEKICDQSDCADTDEVNDTPNQSTCQFGCPDLSFDDCDGTAMGMNYMDYVNDECKTMFTAGQVARMRASIFVARSSLLYSDACNAPSIATLDDSERLVVNKVDAKGDVVFSIITAQPESIVWQFIDLQGKIIQSDIGNSNAPLIVNIETLPNGVYILGAKINRQWIYKKVFILK